MLAEGDDIVSYLHRHERKELLRFVAVGSVDDGKSTLIGRLLHDTAAVYDDQLAAVRRASSRSGEEVDFSLFTDGLLAEREQGITIDVAYRYFSTEKRKFIIADTPGHVQYTRNMATGASTADVAIILVDARLGVLPQSRRHAAIAALLGIPHLVCCVNKMDLVGWDQGVFDRIVADMRRVVAQIGAAGQGDGAPRGFDGVTFIPVSALRGDNVARPSESATFYDGPTLLDVLETVPLGGRQRAASLRFPVQLVLRPHQDFRGYAGTIASGAVRRGDAVTVLPSRRTTRVAAIETYDGPLDEAFAPTAVTLRLEDEIDVSRGDMIAAVDSPPALLLRFDASLVWLHERPLDPGKTYLLKHTTRTVRAQVTEVRSRLDLETLGSAEKGGLSLNDIGRVTVQCHRPILADPYHVDRTTGAFILIDSLTNDTVAAGMIGARAGGAALEAGTSQVSRTERRARVGHAAGVIAVEGDLGDDAARALAFAIERNLFDRGALAAALPGASSETIAAVVGAGLIAVVVAPPGGLEALEGDMDRARVAPSGADPEGQARAFVRTLEPWFC